MNAIVPPILIEAEAVDLTDDTVTLVDVRTAEQYADGHPTGAVRLDYAAMVRADPPAGGLLPEPEAFNALLQSLGISRSSWVIALDADAGAAASRLIWTLHAYGFQRCSLLHGGYKAWLDAGRPTSTTESHKPASSIELTLQARNVISAEALMERIGEPALGLLDARSAKEFIGEDKRAERGGHIPGAELFEWTDALRGDGSRKLLPDHELQQQLDQRNLTTDKDIVVYCQTHHRSSLSYVMLKHLGYDSVMALDGAWSVWGNRADTPIDSD